MSEAELTEIRAERSRAGMKPLHEMSVEEARAAEDALLEAEAAPMEPVAEIEELTLPGPGGPLRARVYRPERPSPLPALLYFVGGGWVRRTPAGGDRICRALARRAGCVVMSVGYRLAPEHPFPAAVEDAWQSTQWLSHKAGELGVDPRRIGVGGDSAGGNLAAVVTLMARTVGTPTLAFQLLIYPVTDYMPDTESMRRATDPRFLTARAMAWYWGHYLEDPADATSLRVSPLRAPRFDRLPPAHVIVAELDPLHDEGIAYAERLASAGVPVEVARYSRAVHGFVGMPIRTADEALSRAAASMRQAFLSSGE
jgi:acetyl esterase